MRDETVIKERSKLATLLRAQELKQENSSKQGLCYQSVHECGTLTKLSTMDGIRMSVTMH